MAIPGTLEACPEPQPRARRWGLEGIRERVVPSRQVYKQSRPQTGYRAGGEEQGGQDPLQGDMWGPATMLWQDLGRG